MENSSLTTALAAAERLSHLGRLSEAIALLEPQLTLPFATLSEALESAVFLLSSLYLLTEQFREGEKLVEAALSAASPEQKADLHRRRSHFYDARGHHLKAAHEREVTAQAEALLEEKDTRAFLHTLRVSVEHDPQATLAATQETLRLLPQNRAAVSAMLSLAASSAYEAGLYDEARKLAGKTLAHSHASPAEQTIALQIKALVHAVKGEHPRALTRFQEATYLARKGADWQSATELTLQISHYLHLLGQTQTAEELIEETLTRFAYPSPAAQNLLVLYACSRGEFARMEEALQRAEASTRKRHLLALARAAVALEKQDYPQALTALNERVRFLGGVAQYLARMSRVPVLWQVGKQKEAEQEYAALLALFSESLSAEQQAAFYRMEARLAYLRKDWSAGVTTWKKVLRLDPHPINQPENWVQLGDGYMALQELEAARFAWGRGAAQPVESVWVRRAKERLEAS